MIYRIFVEKKDNVQARKEAADIKTLLGIDTEDLRLILRYDVEGLSEEELNASLGTVFSEPPVDNVYLENLEIPNGYRAFAVSYLTGQYDQRADSAAQCVQLLTKKSRPLIKCARVYLVKGVTEEELVKIKKHIINPVESEEVGFEKPQTLVREMVEGAPVQDVAGFIEMTDESIAEYHRNIGFANQIRTAKIALLANNVQGFSASAIGPPNDLKSCHTVIRNNIAQAIYCITVNATPTNGK